MKKKIRSDFEKRQYMISEDFEIFYYSDIRFRNIQPHSHDYYEFYFPLSEQTDMEIMGKRYPLNRMCAVLVPPGIVHRAVSTGEDTYRRFVFWISSAYFDHLKKTQASAVSVLEECVRRKQYLFHFTENEIISLHAKILRLMDEKQENRYGCESFEDLCIRDLLMTMCRMIHEKNTPKGKSQQLKLLDITQYIDHHLEEDLSLDDLAGIFYVSKYYIAHRFRERLGISVHQYILKKRLEQCAASIAKGSSITRTFTEYGFRDYASFYRAFRKEYGISPKEYQEASA